MPMETELFPRPITATTLSRLHLLTVLPLRPPMHPVLRVEGQRVLRVRLVNREQPAIQVQRVRKETRELQAHQALRVTPGQRVPRVRKEPKALPELLAHQDHKVLQVFKEQREIPGRLVIPVLKGLKVLRVQTVPMELME